MTTPTALTCPEGTAGCPCPPPDSATQQRLADYYPHRLDPGLWARLAPQVRCAVRLCRPTSPEDARHLATAVTGFLSTYRPTESQRLLDVLTHSRIASHTKAMERSGTSPSTVRNSKARLLRVRVALNAPASLQAGAAQRRTPAAVPALTPELAAARDELNRPAPTWQTITELGLGWPELKRIAVTLSYVDPADHWGVLRG